MESALKVNPVGQGREQNWVERGQTEKPSQQRPSWCHWEPTDRCVEHACVEFYMVFCSLPAFWWCLSMKAGLSVSAAERDMAVTVWGRGTSLPLSRADGSSRCGPCLDRCLVVKKRGFRTEWPPQKSRSAA